MPKGVYPRVKPVSQETREKMRRSVLKRFRDPIEKERMIKNWRNYDVTGQAPWNKGTRSPGLHGVSKKEDRRDAFYDECRQKAFARDGYTCQICLAQNSNLHVDHILPWASNPELRYELSNLRTLCRACHYYVTFKRKMPINSGWSLGRTEGESK